eukprot:5221447-Alexandrium_andersonii.AAC.1
MSASLVGSEMCIRDSRETLGNCRETSREVWGGLGRSREASAGVGRPWGCLLYTSDAADDM